VSPLFLFQDTVVALHALSKYGAATFTRTGKAVQVTIQSSGTFSKEFQVNNNNRLLLQRVSLERVPGEYSIKATGEGCVYLQVRRSGRRGFLGIFSLKRIGQIRKRGEEIRKNSKERRKTDFCL
jgi:hypothetical protein